MHISHKISDQVILRKKRIDQVMTCVAVKKPVYLYIIPAITA